MQFVGADGWESLRGVFQPAPPPECRVSGLLIGEVAGKISSVCAAVYISCGPLVRPATHRATGARLLTAACVCSGMVAEFWSWRVAASRYATRPAGATRRKRSSRSLQLVIDGLPRHASAPRARRAYHVRIAKVCRPRHRSRCTINSLLCPVAIASLGAAGCSPCLLCPQAAV